MMFNYYSLHSANRQGTDSESDITETRLLVTPSTRTCAARSLTSNITPCIPSRPAALYALRRPPPAIFLWSAFWALLSRSHDGRLREGRSLCPAAFITPRLMRRPFANVLPPPLAELHVSTESVSARPSVCFPASKGSPARPQIDSMVEIKPAHEVAAAHALDHHEEGKFRLLYSKSKVYVNPTVYSRDNIPGFVALVKRVRTLRASGTSTHVAV